MSLTQVQRRLASLAFSAFNMISAGHPMAGERIEAATVESVGGAPKEYDHARAVNAAFKHSADLNKDSRVRVGFFAGKITLMDEPQDDLLQGMDVISESQESIGKTNMRARDLFSGAASGQFWDKQKTIILSAAGNGGDGDHYAAQSSSLYNGKWLQVGAATIKPAWKHGPFFIPLQHPAGYSSKDGPSFVAANPFETGFTTPFYKSAADIIEESGEHFSGFLPESMAKCRDVAKTPAEETGWYWKPVLKHRVEDCVQMELDKVSDQHGFARKPLEGTSFTAPNAGGMIASTMSRKPGLAHEDYVAAALIAAKPLTIPVSPFGATVDYRPNGSGIVAYDVTNKTGFGLETQEALDQAAEEMLRLKARRPELATVQHRVGSGKIQFATPPGQDGPDQTPVTNFYDLPVRDDALNLRTVIEAHLRGSYDDYRKTPEITLISPDGAVIPLVTTVAIEDDPTLFASTNAFFGTPAKGTWRLAVKGGALSAAEITVAGVERGGLIDAFIDERRQEKPRPQPLSPVMDTAMARYGAPANPSRDFHYP